MANLLDPRLRSGGDAHRRQKQVARLVGGRSGAHPEALAVYERNRMLTPTNARGYRAQVQTLLGWSSLPWLHTIASPTLVLAGDDDPIVPTINSRVLTRLIPDCRRYLVHGAGHLFPLDQPEDIVGVIDAFLGTTSDPERRRKRVRLRELAAKMRATDRRRVGRALR
jgi:pimeloyl-ACP methyl ester carboxylesterase